MQGKKFADSFFSWLEAPLRTLGYVFGASYCVDQLAELLNTADAVTFERFASSPFFKNFDNLVYLFWVASILYGIKDRYIRTLRSKVDPLAPKSIEIDMIDKLVSMSLFVIGASLALQAVRGPGDRVRGGGSVDVDVGGSVDVGVWTWVRTGRAFSCMVCFHARTMAHFPLDSLPETAV